ncbi:membrane protein RseC [Syntrophotalea carbinolica DSM 2380]|uniref:Membrane protein RseC n=1 Tax=Syntrophotalea carbinolica (strain DSM 2380 / NBRC 103641 / GraBd1) TaxID=338963 RepID=Q3A3J1_SYNC1|nr:SoxR reducing system RseC family protein [Syntrophotalea carbinolica]ABA89066.1 membrane protein RseC [Syntrophotalea carbinolica DSM 2380]
MMQETGTVVELRGCHVAMVLCRKSTFCAGCAAMGLCHVGDDGRSMLVETHNVLGAVVGDKVRLASRAGQFLLASFLLYVVPLLALIGGAVLGEIIGAFYTLRIDPNLLAAIFGLSFLVGSFFIIRIGSRAIPRGTFMPEIIEILPGEECSEEQHGY